MLWPGKIVRWSFYLLVFLVPLIFLPNTSELFEFNKMVLTYLITVTITAAWLARMLFEKKIIFRRTALDFPILIYLIVQLLSLLFSIDPRTSWLGYYSRFNGGLVSLVCYSLLYWAFVSNTDRTSALRTVNYLLLASLLVAFYGVLEHFGIDASLWVQDVQHRVFSTLGQPNWLAAYLVTLLPVSLSLAVSAKKNLTRTYYGLISLVNLTAILFTRSQSGIGVMLVVLPVYLFLLLVQKRRIRLILSGVGLFIMIGLLNFRYISASVRSLSYLLTTRDLSSVAREESSRIVGGSSSTLIRRIVWQGAFDIWRSSGKNLLLGTGPETFAMSYYQFRPQAHNFTSEWELLYNKAHNEFVNHLSTTGILGLGSYLLLLFTMFFLLFKSQKNNPDLLYPALLAGWISIPVTNFWGFSVVIVQILMFLLPGLAFALSVPPVRTNSSSGFDLGWGRIIAFLSLGSLTLFLYYTIICYWSADVYYASSQKNLQIYSATQNPLYISQSYSNLAQAYDLNPNDAPISSQLGLLAANMAVYIQDAGDATAAAQYVRISLAASSKALMDSPYHPNYYKISARSLITLSLIDPQYMQMADQVLADAEKISPTDPRLPYQRGLIAQRLGNLDQANQYYSRAIELKPDFADALNKIRELVK